MSLRAWHTAAARRARNRRLARARRRSLNRASLAAIWDAWRVLATGRVVELHVREIHRLQASGAEGGPRGRAGQRPHGDARLPRLSFLR